MLWHRGDPAGRTWHESLGIRFKTMVAREIEDLLDLLLRTPFFNVSKSMPAKMSLLNIARTDRSTDKNELNCYRLKLTQYSRARTGS